MTAQAAARTEEYVTPWPPHDTEESVLGTDLHQTTITNLRLGINGAAELAAPAGGPPPWHALTQTCLLGGFRPDGSNLRTYPDLFVYTSPIDPLRGSVSMLVEGTPVLVIEVLSEATFASDTDLRQGKGYTYAMAGVPEYLTLDPTRTLVSEGGRGWRLRDGTYTERWIPQPDERWHAGSIPLAFGLEGIMATVYTHEGQRLLREGEAELEIKQRDDKLAQQAREIEELRRRLTD